jgi:uncharacterized protein YcbK (DUF882 family)
LDLLQALRDKLGYALHISSGARCPKYNTTVGGVPNSKHISSVLRQAHAVDIACTTGAKKAEIIFAARELGFTGFGVARNFIHLDTRASECIIWSY